MWKFTLAQMRRHVSRLAAAGLAIILSTGFIAAAVIGMTAIADTARNAFSADLGKADLIATAAGTGEWLPAGAEAAARATAGVSDTYTPLRQTAVAIGPEHREKIIAQSAPGNPAFLPELAQGRGPAGPDEVVIGAQLAERLGLKVEDELSLTWSLSIPDNLPAAEQEALIAAVEAGELETTRPRQARISGLFKDNNLSLSSSQPGLIGFGQAQDPASGLLDFRPGDTLFLLVEPQADDNATAAAVKQAISPGDSAWQVLAKKDLVEQREQSILGNSSVIGAFVGVFISVALLTAGLVISNTLQVMVAQRARTLSLLRCIGATKAQIRRSVLGEAVLLGGFGGLGGIALGAALIQAALLIARQAYPDIPVPSLISFPPAAVVLPLLAGLAVTAIAALAPARLATRVAPVAALRPQTAPSLKARAGRFRLAFSLLAAVGGAGLLAYAIFLMKQAVGGDASPDNIFTYVGIGVLGGASFFVGAIVGGVFWIPRVVSAVASLVGRFGPGARIAAANTMRNPRRTAATATALIVGVTLVAAVSSGAASVQKTLNQIVDQQTPIDLTVSVPYQPSSGEDAPTAGLPAGLASAITDAPGVKAVATPPTAYLQGAAGACADGACPADAWQPLQTTGIDPALAAQILHGDTVAGPLAAGEAVMSFSAASRSGAQDGGQLTLSGDRGSWTSTVRVTQSWGWDVLLPLDGFTALTSSQTATGAWVAISPDADPIAVFNRVEQIASANPDANGNPPWVDGQAKQRAAFTQVITTLLIIVTALFGVAVIIAFVGVANTLSLSVIERRRESALLRALGLTRGQMRGMLALEGVVIAAVGSLLGLVLGVALGWAGAYLLLSLINSAALAVSPLQIGVMLAIAIVAGLIASVLPGRSAANAQPALALASE